MIKKYDVIIIGGGATGAGVAVESITRKYKTILFEEYDFGSGTSSKSTKLVHGGLRYLANLDFHLIYEGLTERHYFIKNAPHLAHEQSYLVPFYTWREKLAYLIAINSYQFLSGCKKIGKIRLLSKQEIINQVPNIKQKNLIGGAIYYDGQFDDTRMLISLIKTFEQKGGHAYNYHKVVDIIKDNNRAIGVKVFNKLTNQEQIYHAKVIINATGAFSDAILNLDNPQIKHNNIIATQGTHLVFEHQLFPSQHAVVIPKTPDGRIIFILPWQGVSLVGTTDIKLDKPVIEPTATNDEVNFILETLNQYTNKIITHKDIKSIFTGIRPLVKTANAKNNAKISRKHKILYSDSGIITILGGKWTIYRKMGEDAINFAIKHNLLLPSRSVTKNTMLVDATHDKLDYPLSVYGTESIKIITIQTEINNFDLIHPALPYYIAEVIYQVRYEKAITIEDVLARRTRALYLNAQAAIESSRLVAEIMAKELKMNQQWIDNQVNSFYQYAKHYTLCSLSQ